MLFPRYCLPYPTILLYEISIFLAKTMSNKRQKEMAQFLQETDDEKSFEENKKDTYDYNPYDSKKL